jgi:hypothetical protein
MELQLGIRLPFPKLPQGVRDDAMPRRVFCEAYAQRPGLTAGQPCGPLGSLIDLLKNAPRIFQEQLASHAQPYATRQPLNNLKPSSSSRS